VSQVGSRIRAPEIIEARWAGERSGICAGLRRRRMRGWPFWSWSARRTGPCRQLAPVRSDTATYRHRGPTSSPRLAAVDRGGLVNHDHSTGLNVFVVTTYGRLQAARLRMRQTRARYPTAHGSGRRNGARAGTGTTETYIRRRRGSCASRADPAATVLARRVMYAMVAGIRVAAAEGQRKRS